MESQLQFYLNLRSHARNYREYIKEICAVPDKTVAASSEQTKRRWATILLLDLEASVYLKAWHSLQSIIDELALNFLPSNHRVFASAADLVLASRAPTPELLSTLQHMVNTLSSLEPPHALSKTELARWIRCLVHIALPSNPEAAEQVLTQVPEIVAESALPPAEVILHPGRHEYPAEELEWLVAETWNKAVEFVCVDDRLAFSRWADLAVRIAACMSDGGEMGETLSKKRAELVFREEKERF